MSTARERFRVILAGQYRHLFTTPEYATAAARYTPEALADKMIAGLLDGTADKGGEGVKTTCKVLGLKHTYKAIRDYLRPQP